MYAIAHIFYGIPLNDNNVAGNVDWSEELDDAVENEEPGFHRYYTEVIPAAFGIELAKFDDVEMVNIKLVPTHDQMMEFDKLFKALPADLRQEINKKFGQPRVLLLWSTS